MESKNSNSLMLISGIIAGAATVYFLKSPKGKQVIDLLLEKGELLKEEITEQANAALNKSQEKIEEVIDTGSEIVEKLDTHLAKAKQKVSLNAEETQSNFDSGIKTAISKLKNA